MKATEGCAWFTHDSAGGACYTFEDCPNIDESCDTCVSGEDDCERAEPQPSSNTTTGCPTVTDTTLIWNIFRKC